MIVCMLYDPGEMSVVVTFILANQRCGLGPPTLLCFALPDSGTINIEDINRTSQVIITSYASVVRQFVVQVCCMAVSYIFR